MKKTIACMASLALTTLNINAESNDIIGKSNFSFKSDRMTPEALWAMGRIGAFSVSPDNKTIAYNVAYYSVEQNKSHRILYTIGTDGKNQKQLTNSKFNETDACWIKGGTKIAYLSNESGTSQVWMMNPDGTSREQLSNSKDDIEGFIFSPDEKKIILIKQVDYDKSIAKKEADLPKASGMVINDLMFRHWDEFVTSIPQPFVAEFDGKQIKNEKNILDSEPYESPMKPFGGTEQLAWSPDSKKIAYTCRKKTGLAYAISTDSDIFLYDTENGTTRNLCKPAGYKRPEVDATTSLQHQSVNKNAEDCNMGYDTNPSFSPDGKYIAWLSMERDGYESDRTRLCVMNLATGKKSYVTESFDSGVESFVWAKDNKTIYFTGVWHARTSIYSTNLKGEVKLVAGGDYDYATISLCGKELVAARHSISMADEIYSVSLGKKNSVKQITFENKNFYDNLAFGKVVERTVKTTDGKDMLCWVIYPSHFDPSKKYPTLLFCEGGPQSPVSQFWSYRWNFQIMAANDYIIIAPNRRGLPGFGSEWLEEISGDYSGQCMNDYKSAIDDICKESYVDKDHLGCVGASFGGFSVYWLAGNHDKRFKCFIAHDGIFNIEQQYLETEEMWFANWDMGGAYWNKDNKTAQRTFANSPHRFVDKWDTPILCIHGEKDYRILSSQGQSAFAAAQLRGIPSQLLLYPDENHWVLKPQNGILWQRTFFRWLDKYLKK